MNADVCVIIPCFRCSDTILRAVESVAKQSTLPSEVILVDDGSGDNTLEALYQIQRTYSKDWIKVISLTSNKGVSVARNVAWDSTLCTYVAFLDADDVYHPQKIAVQYSWMRNSPRVVLSGHKCFIVNPNSALDIVGPVGDFKTHYISKKQLLLSNPFVTPSFMIKRRLEYRFDPARKHTEDYYLLQQIGLDGHTIAMLDVELVYVYKKLGVSGASSDLWRMRFGDAKNYWSLWRSKRINLPSTMVLILHTILKFAILLLFGTKVHSIFRRLLHRMLGRNSSDVTLC